MFAREDTGTWPWNAFASPPKQRMTERQIFLEMADAWTVVAFEDSYSYRIRFAIGVGDERAERTPRALAGLFAGSLAVRKDREQDRSRP